MARSRSASTSTAVTVTQLEPLVVDALELLGDDLAEQLVEPGRARVLAGAAPADGDVAIGRPPASRARRRRTSTSGNDQTKRSTASMTSAAWRGRAGHAGEAELGALPRVLVADLGRRHAGSGGGRPSRIGVTTDRFSFSEWRRRAMRSIDRRARATWTTTASTPLGAGDLPLLEGLDDVAGLEVLEVGEADAALEALATSRASSLKRLQRRDRALPDDRALAEEADLGAAGDRRR